MIMYFKLLGKIAVPCINMLDWARWFEEADRQVGLTEIGPLTVSTVFLGLDFGFGGKPRLFETMIMSGNEKLIELGKRKRLISDFLDYQTRCETWGEAEEMHRVACAWATEQLAKIDNIIRLPDRSSLDK
jgi:hypothetical protein